MNVRGGLVGILCLALFILAFASSASAQQDDKVGPFVLDAHVAFPFFSKVSGIAQGLGLRADQLPTRGLGFELGAHVYPLRGRNVSLGLGATFLKGRARKAPAVDAPTEPTIESRITALTPQLSLNFGTTRGWSYISGGYGWSRRVTGNADSTLPEGVRLKTFSYGGGARWFLSSHVAFSFDLRFYKMPPQTADATAGVPSSPRHTMFVGTAGLSFK